MSTMAPTIATSEIADFVLHKGNGVKGLAETGIKVLPRQYIQPIEERLDLSKMVKTGGDQDQSIPIIDMSNWEHNIKFPKLVCEAAEKWGFFQIINHGVDIEAIDKVKQATHRFFGLSGDEKRKYLKENSGTNNVRFGTSFVPEIEAAWEWKDYLSLFYVSDNEASSFWPPSCKNEVLEYMEKTNIMIKQLLGVLMKGLNVDDIDETKENLLMGSRRINLNYYPICPNPELTVGVGRHSDVSTLTILLQDDIGGLYVRGMTGDDWIHVTPIKGSLVINVGDALQILSNGKYKSIEHRVIANGKKNRISVPIFVNPRPNDMIGPLPEVTANGEKQIYKQVLYTDYVKHFYKKAHNGKDTLEFAKI